MWARAMNSAAAGQPPGEPSGQVENNFTLEHYRGLLSELVIRQDDAFRKEGIADFLQGKYKPGLESHDQASQKSAEK